MSFTLLVLAAGMGSRYGGLKQLDPVGPCGELVLDYSVHDAMVAGFTQVVFVIRQEFEEEFRRRVASRYEGKLGVQFAFQELADLPSGFTVPGDREKPWGTGHAIWSARTVVSGPFLAVNADDFYGREAFSIMAGHLGQSPDIGLVTYKLGRTLSEHGAVARGICRVSDGKLKSIEEHVQIRRGEDGKITGVDTTGSVKVLEEGTPVSMNFWGFPEKIFPELERQFEEFLRGGGLNNPKAEFYIPSAVNSLMASGDFQVAAMPTNENWFGVTYREDRERVVNALVELVKKGEYHSPLIP